VLEMRVTDLVSRKASSATLLAEEGSRCLLSVETAIPLDRPIQMELTKELWLAEVIGATAVGEGATIVARICHTLKRADCARLSPRLANQAA
jgi:hypothetical protein